MTNLAAVRNILQHLAEAVPDTWRQDRVFRGAVIGAGVTLAILLVRPGASHQDRQLPPLSTLPAGIPAIPLPVVRGAAPATQIPAPPAEVQKIAPGHPLGDVTVVPAPNGDRFGTVNSGKHP